MPRLTLRTLLAYIDDTLEPAQARSLGRKVAESDEARQLIERIKRVTRRRGLKSPMPDGSDDDVSDPNTVAAYLSDNLDSEQLRQIESTCLESDVHLAEVAACHQILTLLLTEPVRVPPTAHQRMYLLVPPPASDPSRKPGKTIPVGGIKTSDPEAAEIDDPDAAFLLGMRRYTAADSKAGRVKLFAAVAVLGLCLVLAVIMALPYGAAEPAISPRGPAFASATNEVTPRELAPEPRVVPEGKPAGGGKAGSKAETSGPNAKKESPEKVPKETSGTGGAKAPGKEGSGVPALDVKRVQPPSQGQAVVGTMEQPNVIVVAKSPAPGSQWLRVDPANPKVNASSAVMALPGYKADVKLDGGVGVLLWGSIPDQIPEPAQMKPIVLQSRVRFHEPPAGFAADITLEDGRIYLKAAKLTGGKVRVRINAPAWNNIASETWDIDLPTDKDQVMVEAHTAFVPGTPYPKDGVGGEPPRIDAILVVVRGTAAVEDVARFAKYPGIAQGNQVAWNSKSDKLAITPVNRAEIVPEPDPLIPAEKGEQIQKRLSDAASSFKDRDGIRPLLEARLNYAKSQEFDAARAIAIYSYAAILDGMDPAEVKVMVGNLYDNLADSERIAVRQAAVTAVGAWMARAPGNTSLFVSVLISAKMIPPEDANLMANLLRGYSAAKFGPAKDDPTKIDDLISFLDSQYIPIREAALGSLIYYYDYPAAIAGGVKTLPPLTDVGTKGPGYDQFLKDWKIRGEELKKWMAGKTPEMPEKK